MSQEFKKGSMAYIVHPYAETTLIGMPVLLVEEQNGYIWLSARNGGKSGGPGKGWHVEAYGPLFPRLIATNCLKPFEDGNGADETLSWSTVPTTTKRLTEAEFDAARAKWGERV